jgi:alpha-D-xyloside xylohydrolase
LYVYTGKNGDFELYEDEGVNYNYEQGQFSRISFRYNEADMKLTIGTREGMFNGMLEKRTIQIIWIKKDKPIGIDEVVKPAQVISYEGKEVIVNMN